MKKVKNLIYVVGLLVVALVCFAFTPNLSNNIVNAYNAPSNVTDFEDVSLTNGNFASNPNQTYLDKSPNGWKLIKESSSATSGVINVGKNFSANASNYQLGSDKNPEKPSSSYDDKVLMINAKNSQGIESQTSQGFVYEDITFDSYSYYEVSVWVKTMDNAVASVYLTGFDEDEYSTENFLNISTTNWKNYTFYVQTNHLSAKTNLSLYLGANENNGSIGVAFFDNISVKKLAQSKFVEQVNSIANPNEVILITAPINIETKYTNPQYNFNFEQGNVSGTWLIEGEYEPSTTTARVAKLSDGALMEQYGLPTTLGTNKNYNNTYGLVISAQEKGYVGYVSKESIDIEQFGIYKITLDVKVDGLEGNAYVNLIENNDVNEFYGEDVDFYAPTTDSIKIGTNSSNNLKNKYNTISFYVEGHSLYSTSFKLGLFLGAENDLSKGTVAFDEIIIEKISAQTFSSAKTDNYNKKITLTTTTETPSVENGYFNSVDGQKVDATFPLKAENWSQTTSENETNNVWGVVNTNENQWVNNGLSLANPRNPSFNINGTFVQTPITDTNNILMAYNKIPSYQALQGPVITLSKDAFYTLSFDYKTIKMINDDSNILNVYLKDKNGQIIFEDLGLESNAWTNYEITLKTEYYSTDINLVLEIGKEDALTQGVIYLDNLTIEKVEYTNDEFKAILDNENSKVVDLANIGFNIKGENKNAFGIYNALMFDGALENGNQISGSDDLAVGGIIDENNAFDIEFPETNTNLSKNMLVIANHAPATYSLTSKYDIDLTGASYYKFTVYIQTTFSGTPAEDEESNYGAEFKLAGLDGASISKIRATSFDKYEIFAYVDSSTTVNVKFALVSDSLETIGNAYFDNFSFKTITEDEYNNATESANTLIFTNANENEENEETTPEEEPEETGSANVWIAVSTIIMTVAIILAIILFYLRKIDFKKRNTTSTKSTNIYDRNRTVMRDAVIKEAEKRRNEEVKKLQGEIKELEDYLAKIEQQHKENVEENRKQHGKTITRQAEKEFKQYVNQRARITKDIEKINQEIREVQSPDYLLKMEKIISFEKSREVKNVEDENLNTTQANNANKNDLENKEIKNSENVNQTENISSENNQNENSEQSENKTEN